MHATHVEIWAAIALLPLLFYASALSRGKPAPKLRSRFAPYVLFLSCFSPVYFTGGILSPLLGVLSLLTFCVTVFSGLVSALVISALSTAILSYEHDAASLAPLALIWVGPVLGRFMGIFRVSPEILNFSPERENLNEPRSVSIEVEPEVDTSAKLEKNLSTLLDLAHHAHPAWNALLLLKKDGGRFSCHMGRIRQGGLNLDFSVGEGEGLLGLPLKDPKPVKIPDLAESTALALPYYQGSFRPRALLVMPLFDEGELSGALVADRVEAGAWSADEEAAANKLGHQVVQLSQDAAHLERIQSKGRQLNELYEISKRFSDDLDRDALISRFQDLLGRLVKFDSYYLAMREDEGDFELVASLGYGQGFQSAFKLAEDTVLGGWVLNAGEPLSFNAAHASAAIPQFLSEGIEAGSGSFLLVPLMRHGRVTGLLKLDRGGSEPFSEPDKEVAAIFAGLAAVTLENARLYTQHKRQATTDGLTGLYNHRYFQERLALEIDTAKRTGKPLSLALTDIDFFKKFNDTFGHQEGDNVLRKCSKLLRDSVRQGKDVVCRYGGEEFVIILPDCDLVEAREVVEHVRQTCADTLIGGTGPEARAIHLSIGLCSYPLGAQEQRDIIHKADEALYKAKQTGRNRTCSFKDLP